MRSQILLPKKLENDDHALPKCYPFVKWAGGKSQLLCQIGNLIPKKFSRYFEPFLGGGAVFFYLICKKNLKFNGYLSDINCELIDTYNAIKNNVDELILILQVHQKQFEKSPYEYYYKIRSRIKFSNTTEIAARFIFLNKTCYNGLYRVNKKGLFNVPMGRYKRPLICDANNLRNTSILLNNSDVHIEYSDYRRMLNKYAQAGDFIYIDPPYDPTSSTSNFTSYSNNKFTEQDQKNLASLFKDLSHKGCKVLLSNSNTDLIKELYSDFLNGSTKINVIRAINSNGSRRSGHQELLIRNYC